MTTQIQNQTANDTDKKWLDAITTGSVAGLNINQKLAYLQMRCDAVGLDHRTAALQYVSINGKEVLYAGKACSDQLINLHNLTVAVADEAIDKELGIYKVRARATRNDGSYVEDLGIVSVGKNLQGDNLVNAMLKAVTKAKRRAVLSCCGLGALDETEIDTIPGAKIVNLNAVDEQKSIDAPKKINIEKCVEKIEATLSREELKKYLTKIEENKDISHDDKEILRQKIAIKIYDLEIDEVGDISGEECMHESEYAE